MDVIEALKAAVLGLVEGLTEFLPVSSTGHLLLLGHFLGFESTGHTFEVLIQLGAILAILSVYSARIIYLLRTLRTRPETQRFVTGVLLGFLPAAFLGVLLHSFIKTVLFNPWIVCVSLIVGGLILLVVDNLKLEPRHNDAETFSLKMYLAIGAAQCLAMIPGVSRSGATIVSAMLMGSSKRAAAEFSFWLAMPTMAGAFAWDLIKNYKNLTLNDGGLILIGFVMAFASGLFVVRGLLNYVSKRGFSLFAWWRLIVGSAGLAGLIVFG